jgi:2'-5' RNA ligase
VERRPYHPHLTLARARRGGDARPAAAEAELAGFGGSPWRADRVHLVRSHLGPPLRYEPIASWPLGGPG